MYDGGNKNTLTSDFTTFLVLHVHIKLTKRKKKTETCRCLSIYTFLYFEVLHIYFAPIQSVVGYDKNVPKNTNIWNKNWFLNDGLIEITIILNRF